MKVAGSKKSGEGASKIYSRKLWYYPLLAVFNDQEEPRTANPSSVEAISHRMNIRTVI